MALGGVTPSFLAAGLFGLVLEWASSASLSAGCCPCETASGHLEIQHGLVSSKMKIFVKQFYISDGYTACCKLPNTRLKQLV